MFAPSRNNRPLISWASTAQPRRHSIAPDIHLRSLESCPSSTMDERAARSPQPSVLRVPRDREAHAGLRGTTLSRRAEPMPWHPCSETLASALPALSRLALDRGQAPTPSGVRRLRPSHRGRRAAQALVSALRTPAHRLDMQGDELDLHQQSQGTKIPGLRGTRMRLDFELPRTGPRLRRDQRIVGGSCPRWNRNHAYCARSPPT